MGGWVGWRAGGWWKSTCTALTVSGDVCVCLCNAVGLPVGDECHRCAVGAIGTGGSVLPEHYCNLPKWPVATIRPHEWRRRTGTFLLIMLMMVMMISGDDDAHDDDGDDDDIVATRSQHHAFACFSSVSRSAARAAVHPRCCRQPHHDPNTTDVAHATLPLTRTLTLVCTPISGLLSPSHGVCGWYRWLGMVCWWSH